jgi:hypothetical protein
MDRLVDMFFYGLHMDGAYLAAKGGTPKAAAHRASPRSLRCGGDEGHPDTRFG